MIFSRGGVRMGARLVIVNFYCQAFRGLKRCGAHCVFEVFASTKKDMILIIDPLSRDDFFADLKRVGF